ncbi:MAG: argininosuccinate lyase, partial [Bdellovibrionales bacterium]
MAKRKQKTSGSRANPLWGGHYAEGPAAIMAKINASVDVDRRLYAEDIEASKAHAAMLAKQGIISPKDARAIAKGLDKIRLEIDKGIFNFSGALEDVHMNIEARLADLVGEPARRLHTARSRNDQVAVDTRLWFRGMLDNTDRALRDLQKSLLDQAEKNAATLMPGFTHLQPAQPVTFGHHLLAYVEMLGRDRGRFKDCRRRANESPLGAAALAGTSFPIDRYMTSKALNFLEPMRNSIDAVSARDVALEFM